MLSSRCMQCRGRILCFPSLQTLQRDTRMVKLLLEHGAAREQPFLLDMRPLRAGTLFVTKVIHVVALLPTNRRAGLLPDGLLGMSSCSSGCW